MVGPSSPMFLPLAHSAATASPHCHVERHRCRDPTPVHPHTDLCLSTLPSNSGSPNLATEFRVGPPVDLTSPTAVGTNAYADCLLPLNTLFRVSDLHSRLAYKNKHIHSSIPRQMFRQRNFSKHQSSENIKRLVKHSRICRRSTAGCFSACQDQGIRTRRALLPHVHAVLFTAYTAHQSGHRFDPR